ncbi:LPS translocon maturation chaperone LptM [Halomonas sp. C05BenzN]|uniref:LPS translocon maturation chaperone LptM n=1 Tax=Halomonas sp. C05BenzN TaxID=3411041 RepID=UPI003B93C634
MHRIAFAALALLVGLAGCGQKGPLYLPDDEQAAERYGQPADNDDTPQDSET